MATQPTNLPVPSESPRDLKFNAAKIDEFATSMAEQYIDRLGGSHYTIEGLKRLVLQHIYELGWTLVGTFQAGAVVSNAGDVVQDTTTNLWYRWDDLATIPKTVPPGSTPQTSGGVGYGKWVVVDISDVLRGELASPAGAAMIGVNSGGTVQAVLNDLLYNSTKSKTDVDVQKSAGAFSYFGGQLANFKADMCNPLVQQVNLTLVGDSITWGVGASDVAPSTPRNHSLNDARNNGTSNTWANLLHKYLSREYFAGTPAVESVYPTTIPSGKNVFSYTKVIDLYPGQQGITLTGTWPQVVSASARFGVYFNAAPASGANKLEFALTGNAFSVIFAAEPAGTTYAVYVDNVLLGTYPTSSTVIGVPTSFGNVRKHDIGPFIGSRTIRIEPNGGAGTTLRIEAIRIEKNLQVINQGIIGVETDEYTTNLLSTAVLERSLHVFIQLGTNDRPLVYADKNKANTVMRFKAALEAMIAALPGKNVVLLCANAVSQNESTYPFNMSNVREIIYKVANEKSIDFVDGFSVINSLRGYSYTTDSDGLHPNDLGHNAMYTNLAKALKSASIKK